VVVLMARPSRRTVVLLAALVAASVTARLGWWQLDRARQKLDLQARILARADQPPLPQAELARDAQAAAAQHYRRTELRGRWLAEHTVYLDNRQMNARQGFYVLTPLQLAPGDVVLVQRGWVPRDFTDRSRLPPLPTPRGEVRVPGRVAPPPGQLLALAGEDRGLIRQNLDMAVFAKDLGLPLRPLSLQQTAAEQAAAEAGAESEAPVRDGLLRQWPAVAVDVGKHHGYAFQWFALCALIVGLTAWFQFIRPAHRISSRTQPEPSE